MSILKATQEEIDAFEEAFSFAKLGPYQRSQHYALSFMPFLVGYRAARASVTLQEKAELSLRTQFADAGEKLMDACTEAGCPPNTDMTDWIKETAKRAENSDKLYSMDQMRDFADAHHVTRLTLIRNELRKKALMLEESTRLHTGPGKLDSSLDLRAAAQSAFEAETIRGVIAILPTIQIATYQRRVGYWVRNCFGETVANDCVERNFRFFEEAAELVQSLGMTAYQAHALVDYVYNRPVGVPFQEVGGVMTTLAALCCANKLDMHEAGEAELIRVNDPAIMQKIRMKQASKPKQSPLPQ